jgi:four helix bundle protein
MKEMSTNTITTFKDLHAWNKAHELVLETYKSTREYPSEEIYCLVSQMRRSAVSITSNIAEGYSRKTGKDKIHFYVIALGSLTELQSQLEVSKDLGYLEEMLYTAMIEKSVVVHKLINGLIKSLSKNA